MPTFVITVLVSLLGPVLASYFAATIMRETDQTSAAGDRSCCDHCGKLLRWWEMIPLLSFIVIRGRCLRCDKKLDLRMFLSELIGWVLFLFLGLSYAKWVSSEMISVEMIVIMLIQLITAALLLYLSVYDLFTFSVPTKTINLLVGFALLVNIVFLILAYFVPQKFTSGAYGQWDNLLAGIIAAGFVYLLIWLTKEKGIGAGDMYLAAVLGLMLGLPGLVSAFYVLILSASGMGMLFALKIGKFKGVIVPLVPFISLGYVVALVWAEEIFNLLFIQL